MAPQPPTSGDKSAPASYAPPDPPPVPRNPYRWYHKVAAILLVMFCFEIGIFLVIFPWTPYWSANYFGGFLPRWSDFWNNLYLRGAVSGLGVVNLYISALELFRLRRFAKR